MVQTLTSRPWKLLRRALGTIQRRVGWVAAISVGASAMVAAHAAAGTASANTAHVQLDLLPQATVVGAGDRIYVGLHQRIAPGWHTYWRNPGESGLATKIRWDLPSGWTSGQPAWATPQRVSVAGLTSYVYSGDVLLPFPIQVPASAKRGSIATLGAKVDLVACSDVCIPESAVLTLRLPIGATTKEDSAGASRIRAALAAAPRRDGVRATFWRHGNRLELFATGTALNGASSALFFPYAKDVIADTAPQSSRVGDGGLVVAMAAGEPSPPVLDGVLVLSDGRPFEIHAARRATAPAAMLERSPTRSFAALGELLAEAFLAFCGGLILNLMPCVFPILAMKAVGLARHSGNRAAVRKEGTLFTAGVFATFLSFALATAFMRSLGADLGWGFQLQSPSVVLLLALLFLLSGLSLSGLFEMAPSLQRIGSSLASGGGAIAPFATGTLAVIVATPCTAPLMAPAIGWAATQPVPVGLAIFASLALGFAAPYLALCWAPTGVHRLPAPGPWMARLKAALAFPMFGSAAWLGWVFAREQGVDALPALFGAALAVSLAAWSWGLVQRGEAGRGAVATAIVAGLSALAIGILGLHDATTMNPLAADGASASIDREQRWQPGRVAEFTTRARPVLVDFTAAWCITCQVNRKMVLDSPVVRAALRRTNTALLEADWTTGDPKITRELARFGRDGVPLYVLYSRTGQARILPQLLTAGALSEALDEAAGR